MPRTHPCHHVAVSRRRFRYAVTAAVVAVLSGSACTGPPASHDPARPDVTVAGAAATPATRLPTTSPPPRPPTTGVAAAPGRRAGAGIIRLTGYTRDGQPLTWSAFRARQTNGHPSTAANDMLLDSATLQIVTPWPVREVDGWPTLRRPAGRVSLSLAWPLPDGYSTLIVDLPGPGTYDFHRLAAQQVLADIDTRLRSAPGLVASPRITALRARAHRELASPGGSEADPGAPGTSGGSEADRGRRAAIALDDAATAAAALMVDAGRQTDRDAPDPDVYWGFTLTSRTRGHTDVASVADLMAGRRTRGAVRLVFDAADDPDAYRDRVRAAQQRGLIVVGQLLDSSQLRAMPAARWRERVRAYVAALPTVEVWEVGNEINGNWLGRDAVEKVRYAAGYVRRHTTARVLLTLYWDLGESDPQDSLFTWLRDRLTPADAALIDEVGLSVYPQVHPLGIALDRVVQRLRDVFPGTRVSITELGYGAPDLQQIWTAGPPGASRDAARAYLARLYGVAIRGYRPSGGGPYWWYFTQDAPPGSPLWHTFARLIADTP